MRSPSCHPITRRRFIALTGAAAAASILVGCSDDESASTDSAETIGHQAPADFEARFAGFPLADEPDGDPNKVVFPDFVLAASPEIHELYAFHITNGGLMRYIPCFCGCNATGGHLNNPDCYVREVHADGSITFDPMAPT